MSPTQCLAGKPAEPTEGRGARGWRGQGSRALGRGLGTAPLLSAWQPPSRSFLISQQSALPLRCPWHWQATLGSLSVLWWCLTAGFMC